MSDFSDLSLPFNVASGNENIREALGFFHHQISQLSKDMAFLNKRVADLSKNMRDQDDSAFSVFVEATNKRLDGFGASIQSVTDHLIQHESLVKQNFENLSASIRSEFSDKINKITARVDEIQHKSDNSKCFSDILELKVSELTSAVKTNEESLMEIRNELHALKCDGRAQAVLTPTEPKRKTLNKNGLKKSLSRPATSSRRKRGYCDQAEILTPATVTEHIHVFDCRPRQDILERLEAAQTFLDDLKTTRGFLDKIEQHDREIAFVKNKFNDYALKSELWDLLHEFLSSTQDGVDGTESRRTAFVRPGVIVTPQNSDFGVKNPYVRQKSAHVKLINGDSLKRPFTTGRRMRSYDE